MGSPALPPGTRIGICHVDYREFSTNPGGVYRYLVALKRELAGMGVAVKDVPLRHAGVRILGREVGGLLSMELARRIPTRGVDLVHCVEPFVGKRDADVVTVHDITEYKRPDLFRIGSPEKLAKEVRFLKGVMDRARVVLTDTEHVRQDLLRWHPATPPEKIVPVHLGVDVDYWRPVDAATPRHPALKEGAFNVLVVADIHPRKRVDLLAEAVASLGPEVRLVHVGKRNQAARWATLKEPLDRAVAALEPQGRYVPLDYLPDEELRTLYTQCDLAVFPSFDEGFGLPPLEALACGANVLVSAIPPFRETMGPVARFAPLTVEGLAKGIADAQHAGRPALERTRDHVTRHFTWRLTAERTLDVYRRLLASEWA